MSRLLSVVSACALALAVPAYAADLKHDPVRKVDPVERLLATLAGTEIDFEGKNASDTSLFDMLESVSKKYQLVFVVNKQAFMADGVPNVMEQKPTVTSTQLRGVTIHQSLTLILDSLGATYLVKNGVIEIVPVRHAAVVAKAALDESELGDGGGRVRLNAPLVSAVIKEKPLSEAVAKIADTFDLTIVVSPQVGEAKAGLVSARLLNVPADKAVELLAVQCDLRVVRTAGAYLITSKEQAKELFEEELERERRTAEREALRGGAGG